MKLAVPRNCIFKTKVFISILYILLIFYILSIKMLKTFSKNLKAFNQLFL